MSNRTWACIPCGKTYRRNQTVTNLPCPQCGAPCEYVHWKMRVPSPRNVKKWLAFWRQYRAEKQILAGTGDAPSAGPRHLELLNRIIWSGSMPSGDHESQRKWKDQARRKEAARRHDT
ncbi:hypothetical protein [Allorhodopirellula heiligendammensis]|uniref:hypothetical protein n=1 Tax=Allorhodopirellula heiligendammensis TaxID=2714739 RepID=UPI00265EEA53|nr:hypothetical protein [Allorhodopirellula heiligendammensis]